MTVEAAIALTSIVVVVVFCVAAVLAVTTHIRCVDAAREAARLAARGAGSDATAAVGSVGPRGARVTVRTEGNTVVATVRMSLPLLPGLEIGAQAVSALEPEADPS
ncbi:TadE family type IV pilus minor pilin [Skermania sp. ID1734]|uniref:TadE family type IV pilus minor pilin n=1 Tax=Skermania sp. ID1734 TaxID=2597516 RepID=UPI00210475B1|nr:TadE family type IV pilus minor pilin [Skermania sp. ID1734]